MASNKTIKDIVLNLILVTRSVFGLLEKFKKYFILGFGFILIIEAVILALDYFFKDVIDTFVYTPRLDIPDQLVGLVIIMAILYLVNSIVNFVNDKMLAKTEVKISNFLTLKILRKNLDLSLRYHEEEDTGSKLNKLFQGINRLLFFFDNFFWNVLPTLVKIVFSFVFLLFIDYRIAGVFFLGVPVFLYVTLRANLKLEPRRLIVRRNEEKVYGQIGQAIYNIKTVKAYTREEEEQKKGKSRLDFIFRKIIENFNIIFLANFFRENIIGVGKIIIIIIGGYLAYLGEITPGELVLFISVSTGTYYSMYALTRTFDQLMNAKVAVERMLKVLNSKDEIKVDENPIKLQVKGAIEFKNVSFDYGEGKVLKNIDLKIKPGEIVALVGPSGGGKSTLAKLLYRYYDVQHGSILIDDEHIEKLDLKSYRSQLGIVDQDIDVFNETVSGNIAYGNPKASLKQIKDAAKIANADEFIKKFKKKYNTLVGERGVKLSGGQKQRIGIARAILVDPKILILDEATSSLDAGSEKMIQEAIQRVIKNRTTIVIAHRLSTIKNADRIVVLDNGRINQVGTHKQLLAQGGIYKNLVKLQIGGYLH
ncbi:ABC transporter ATP-binding protein [Candidatus Kuenenbacteria bacterium]|nr:ABC transporter ATP-binding protein [Candidatus Kuenenbacteria bacterium]